MTSPDEGGTGTMDSWEVRMAVRAREQLAARRRDRERKLAEARAAWGGAS